MDKHPDTINTGQMIRTVLGSLHEFAPFSWALVEGKYVREALWYRRTQLMRVQLKIETKLLNM